MTSYRHLSDPDERTEKRRGVGLKVNFVKKKKKNMGKNFNFEVEIHGFFSLLNNGFKKTKSFFSLFIFNVDLMDAVLTTQPSEVQII